jgi:hypothetical protein
MLAMTEQVRMRLDRLQGIPDERQASHALGHRATGE